MRSHSVTERDNEWEHAIVMIAWGLWLMAPGDTFGGVQYTLLAEIAPENVWGAFAVGLGLVRVTALAINGSWRRTPAFRLVGAWIGLMWWLTLGYLLLSGPEHHVPAGVVMYPVFAAFEGRSCWRSAMDAFHSGAFKRFRSRSRVRSVA